MFQPWIPPKINSWQYNQANHYSPSSFYSIFRYRNHPYLVVLPSCRPGLPLHLDPNPSKVYLLLSLFKNLFCYILVPHTIGRAIHWHFHMHSIFAPLCVQNSYSYVHQFRTFMCTLFTPLRAQHSPLCVLSLRIFECTTFARSCALFLHLWVHTFHIFICTNFLSSQTHFHIFACKILAFSHALYLCTFVCTTFAPLHAQILHFWMHIICTFMCTTIHTFACTKKTLALSCAPLFAPSCA